MPNINQLRNPDMNGWTPVQMAQASTPSMPEIDRISNPNRSPFMRASMPLAASTNDALDRQFYNGASVPTYRILPAKRGSDT
jgi:hypothetical protein